MEICEITSSSFGYNKYLRQSAKYICDANILCRQLALLSDVRQEVVRDISISRYQLELLSLSEEERNIYIFARPLVCSYLSLPC